MSPLKNRRFGYCAWMPFKIPAKPCVFCTHMLSWGRMVPVRLGAPPWVVGLGLANSVVASGLFGSVRLSPTVAKLKTTGSLACALAVPAAEIATIETAHAALTRRESRFCMKAPSMMQALWRLVLLRAGTFVARWAGTYRGNLTD